MGAAGKPVRGPGQQHRPCPGGSGRPGHAGLGAGRPADPPGASARRLPATTRAGAGRADRGTDRFGRPDDADLVDAARELVVANHVLDTADPQPWRTDPTARAALAADTAQLVEALAVLDQRLDAAGALTGHLAADGEATTTASVTTARLLASTVDRLAQWTADHAPPDLASTPPRRPPAHHQPVRLVRCPGDLAGAQAHLELLLAPMATRDLHLPYRLSADTAATVARNQAILLHHLHDCIAASPEQSGDRTGASARIERLRDPFEQAVYTLTGLYDATGARIQHLLRNQQREISVAVNTGHLAALSDRQATELLCATEATLSTWAAAVRREASRNDTELRVARRGPTGTPLYGRIGEDGPADRALAALAALADSTPTVAKRRGPRPLGPAACCATPSPRPRRVRSPRAGPAPAAGTRTAHRTATAHPRSPHPPGEPGPTGGDRQTMRPAPRCAPGDPGTPSTGPPRTTRREATMPDPVMPDPVIGSVTREGTALAGHARGGHWEAAAGEASRRPDSRRHRALPDGAGRARAPFRGPARPHRHRVHAADAALPSTTPAAGAPR